jgi:CRP-like cAMP-binding protein
MSMAPASRFSKGNLLLNGLSPSDLALLQPNLTSISLPLRHDMEKPQKQIADVYFMEKGIASVVAVFPAGETVEIGLIGCEGMSGSAVVLGNDRSPHSTYIQVTGEGKRIAVDDLRAAMKKSESLRSRLLKFVQAFTVQTAHTAVANARATLPQRLARWVLMSHDRVAGDRLALTHEFLSLMLAVRRAGVTEAIHSLVSQKLITASRGEITVVDRKGLEKVAGDFYGAPEAEYRRLMN